MLSLNLVENILLVLLLDIHVLPRLNLYLYVVCTLLFFPFAMNILPILVAIVTIILPVSLSHNFAPLNLRLIAKQFPEELLVLISQLTTLLFSLLPQSFDTLEILLDMFKVLFRTSALPLSSSRNKKVERRCGR